MNDTTIFTRQLADEAQKPALLTRGLLLSSLSLLVGLSASTWMYFQGVQSLGALSVAHRWEEKSLLLSQFDHWILWAIGPITLGGAIFLGSVVLTLAFWRVTWAKRLQAREAAWSKTNTTLHVELADSKQREEKAARGEAEAKKEASHLSYANAQMRAELDQLKRAEKSLSQRRQELESSKTVLELHVQERTHELQKLQRRYELILNSAGEGICGLGPDGKATFVNPAVANITGWPIAELIGKTEQEIFGRNGANGHAAPHDQGFGERVFHRKDGTCFPVEFVKTPINENGRVAGAVLVFKDITQRKQVEEAIAQKAAELARSNAELEQFAFVASHDLQEPLRKILAFGDRLKLKFEASIAPEAHTYLERMQNAAARMRTLIDDLLAFSRVIRNSEPFAQVDLAIVTKEVLGDLEVRIEKTGARVEIGSLPTIEADQVQMRQLLLNLIGNSLKFQPAGAVPVVKVQSRIFTSISGQELCELTVQDNGIGFEEKYLEKIFAVFQRLHGRTEYEGTGVGLAVCRRIIDRHSGTITAKSQLGQGATFIVVLPVSQPKKTTNS
jgi:PAS domain S-box-containing protein